jgi:hypothetical protein
MTHLCVWCGTPVQWNTRLGWHHRSTGAVRCAEDLLVDPRSSFCAVPAGGTT